MRRGRRVGWLFSETTGQGFEKNALRVGMGWVGGLIASCSFCTMISYIQLFPPHLAAVFFISSPEYFSFLLVFFLAYRGGFCFFRPAKIPQKGNCDFPNTFVDFFFVFCCYHLLSAGGALLLYRSLPRRRNFHGLPFPAGPGSAFYRGGGGLLLCANFPSLSGCAISASSRPLMLGAWCLVFSALTLNP